MLRRRFPNLEIVPSEIRTHRAVNPAAVSALGRRCDLYLHGSGPNPMAVDQWKQWMEITGKPVVVGGITLPPWSLAHRDLLSGVAGLFCRDTVSLQFAESSDLANGRTAFGPDAAFASDVRDDAWAQAFQRQHGLEPDGYACFIGRLRFPPFHKMAQWYRPSDADIATGERLNAATAEPDHAKLRRVIIGWVRATGKKAVICPEMIYQLADADPLLYNPLPDDVKAKTVVVRDWWCTDQATSLYRQAVAVVSMKMHSPVLAQRQGVPALHIRQYEDTAKGQMWRDLGLQHWMFEIDQISGDEPLAALLAIAQNPQAARADVTKAQQCIDAGHAAMMRRVAEILATEFRP
jgi:polysaccharide pyruvyl transferase WcaK-like protein